MDTLTSEVRRIERLEERVSDVSVKVGVFSELFERNLVIQEKLSMAIDQLASTNGEIKLAMAEMQREIREFSALTGSFVKNNDVQRIDEKIKQFEGLTASFVKDEEVRQILEDIKLIKKAIEEIDEKGKIDVVKIARDWLIKVLAGGGIITLLVYLIEKIIALLAK